MHNLIFSPIHLWVLLSIFLHFVHLAENLAFFPHWWVILLHSSFNGIFKCFAIEFVSAEGWPSVFVFAFVFIFMFVFIFVIEWEGAWCVFVLAAQRCLCLSWRSPKWTFRLVCLFQPEMLPDRYCFAMVKITKYKLQNAKYRMLSKRYCFAITSKASNYIICLSQGSLSKGHVSSVLEIQIVIQEKYKFKYRERDCKSHAGNYIVCLSPR